MLKYIISACVLLSVISSLHSVQDTLQGSVIKSDSLRKLRQGESELPREIDTLELYSVSQDSAYKRAMQLKLPVSTILRHEFAIQDYKWRMYEDLKDETTFGQALAELTAEAFKPSGNQMVQQQINLINSFSVPGMNNYNPGAARISFGSIARIFGLEEDVSPEIQYTLEFPSDLEIVVYSMQASVIRTILRGSQPPGRYKIFWNGRDDNGKAMPPGDYVAEVRIKKIGVIRKRIVIR